MRDADRELMSKRDIEMSAQALADTLPAVLSRKQEAINRKKRHH